MPPDNQTEPQRDAFTALLEPVLEAAFRTAYHLTGDREDAQELVQEAALLAFKGFANFQSGTNFKAWFLTILRNRFISEYRKRKRSVETVAIENVPDLYLYSKTTEAAARDAAHDPVHRLLSGLDAEQVAFALKELPFEFREVCTLYFTQDLSYEEIANVLGIPVGTVRSRLHRGRRLLQKRLWTMALEYGIVPAESGRGE